MGQGKSDTAANAHPAADLRNSPDSLFLRYCKGRVRHFAMRQVLTLMGAATLAGLGGTLTGAAALALALAGELLDCLTLRVIVARRPCPPVQRHARLLATLTATLQAASIAAVAAIALVTADHGEADFFVCAFLAAAIINAGLSLPHHAGAAIARIAIHTTTFAAIAVHNVAMFLSGRMLTSEWVFNLVGMTVLMVMSWGFVSYVRAAHLRQMAYERALIGEKLALEASRSELVEKERQARRLALVAENANDSVVITRADGRITWVNETFSKITGYSYDEAIGHTPGELLNAPETDPRTIRRLISAHKSHKPMRIEVLNRRKDGSVIWMETSLTPIFNPDGSHAMTIGVERDISAMKEREAELARARQAAEEAARARTRFLATMSHEIRTPMNGVIGMAELLAETDLAPEQEQALATIVESGRALLTIINDVLDLTRLQSGKPVIRSDPFLIGDTVQGVAEILRPLARGKGVALDLTLPALPVMLLGDAGRIRQIVMNLAGNAVKFTPEGRVELVLTTTPQGGMAAVEVTVRDTGIGIPAERLEGIFDSFTQADGDITRRFGGTGLGLTISRLLAREMGGDITVESRPGAGSLFRLRLTLPLPPGWHCAVADMRLQAQTVQGQAPAAALCSSPAALAAEAGLRILVAEDNATNRLIVGKMLAATGADIAFVENGVSAVERFRDWHPNVILMDLSMPGMDGLEATRRIRALEAGGRLAPCRIVALTANAFDEDREASLAAGCDAFLAKPIGKAALLKTLESRPSAVDAIGL